MKKGVTIILILIVCSSFVFASFEIGDLSHLVKDIDYAPQTNVQGWMNISLNNEPSNSIFKDSFQNSISLINLIKEQNSSFEYNCSTEECASDYIPSNQAQTKTFNLDLSESKLIGMKFTENMDAINSVEFTLESDAISSCYSQIKIDLLNDGIIDAINDKPAILSCSFLKNYGCFNESEQAVNLTIDEVPFCQRVRLHESPSFKMGAWVKEKIVGSKVLTMALYDLQGNFKKSCELPKEGISEGAEIFCNIDYLVAKAEDHYVCIYSDNGNGEYKTQGYQGATNCGFHDSPKATEISTYRIFAQGKGFADVGIINISNSFPEEGTLNSKVSNYIQQTYGSLDCSNDCVVPIKITAGRSQQITMRNLKAIYKTSLGGGIQEIYFYDLIETPAKINADFQKLFFDNAGFTLPADYGDQTFKVSLNDVEIFTEPLETQRIPIIRSVTPITTASAVPTVFKANVESSKNITKYKWEFGDNSTYTTTANEITYTYDEVGQYTLKLTVTDSRERTAFKEFSISIESANDIINRTLKERSVELESIKAEIKEYDEFYQDSLNTVLDIDFLEETLQKARKDYDDAFFEEEYNQIIKVLLALEIPKSLSTTKKADSILFYPQEKYIDLYVLQEIGGGDYDTDDEEKYISAILAWNQENTETKVTFEEISVEYESSIEPILKIFEVKTSEKDSLKYDPYLILEKLENLKFKENYLESEESGHIYLELSKPTTITFSTTENIDIISLPLFVSPPINRLSLGGGDFEEFKEDNSKWIIFGLVVFVLGILGFATYIFLQVWYKKKYENYLFKNKNQLYNLITYVENQRKKGLKDQEISSRLRKSGWDYERISYVLKKHAGKRTGMFEIPLNKMIKRLKNKDEKKPMGRPMRNPLGRPVRRPLGNPRGNPHGNPQKRRFSRDFRHRKF